MSDCCLVPSMLLLSGVRTDTCICATGFGFSCSGDLLGDLVDLAASMFPGVSVLSWLCCTLGGGGLGEGDDVVVRVGDLDLTLLAGDGAARVP